MFNRFKSALYNVVGNFDPTDGGTVGSVGTVSLASGVQNIPSVIRQTSIPGKEKTLKFPYTRPHFLQLNSDDEILVTADHGLRPIICPRDITRLPWNSGYAETINAGKSKKNEDQAAVHVGLLTRCITRSRKPSIEESQKVKSQELPSPASPSVNGLPDNNKEVNGYSINKNDFVSEQTQTYNPETDPSSKKPPQYTDVTDHQNVHSPPLYSKKYKSERKENQVILSLPYYYFGVFDGHAGWGAAVSAANQLHHIIHEKLCDVIELIIPDPDCEDSNLSGPFWSSEKNVSPENAVIGALEQAFWAMDQQIGDDRQRHHLSGGCTACVALFILGKVFVSNAGDSRGVIGYHGESIPMSFDFTPETETQRIRKLGARHPELLGGEFTHLEFLRRPLRSDVGKKAPYRDHFMKGWGLKTITEADLKYPLVCGEGKRSRVLATIGVTRGFGDHDLRAQFSSLPIKPFLSPEPEVRVFDLMNSDITDKDILVLGTDGLWDILSNEKAVSIVCHSLQQFSPEDSHRYKYRYTSAAHDLVLWSRGRLREHQWRTSEDKHATIDDISAFVIPLKPFKLEMKGWRRHLKPLIMEETIDYSEEAVVLSEGPSVLPDNNSNAVNGIDVADSVVTSSKSETLNGSCNSMLPSNGTKKPLLEESEPLVVPMECTATVSSTTKEEEEGDRVDSSTSEQQETISDPSFTGGTINISFPYQNSGPSDNMTSNDTTEVPLTANTSIMDSTTGSAIGDSVHSTINLNDKDENFEDCDNELIK